MKFNYWYFYYFRECPVCGRDDSYKERRYTEKPKEKKNRAKFDQYYDFCMEG